MPMRFELGPGDDRCTIHLEGVVVLADLRGGVTAQRDAGAWTRKTVLETSAATGMVLNFDDVLDLVEFVERVAGELPPRGRTVIVARQPVIYGFARMYQMTVMSRLPTMDLHVVRSRDEADVLLSSDRKPV